MKKLIFNLYCSCLECDQDVVRPRAPHNLSYWTPQTHRKSPSAAAYHYQRNSRRRGSTDRYQRKSEIFTAHKQHQYYSPQVRRRQSAFHYFQQESSDSEAEELIEQQVQVQQFSRGHSRLPYYGGVKPVYLPNSRTKAQKLQQQQKTPLLSNNTQVLPIEQQCQGCCHHHKKHNEDKKCIIS